MGPTREIGPEALDFGLRMSRVLGGLVVALALLGACRAKEKPPDVGLLVAQLRGGDAQKSGQARLQLILLGEAAAPALAELLRTGQPAERLTAANTLWGMGARGRVAVPELVAALGEADVSLRVAAAMALESMGEAAAPAVPALVKALGDRDRAVRQAAVKALGSIGPAAREALPVLTRLLKRASWPEAEEAVQRIQGSSPGPASGETPSRGDAR
jgi:HEAT repeat protein